MPFYELESSSDSNLPKEQFRNLINKFLMEKFKLNTLNQICKDKVASKLLLNLVHPNSKTFNQAIKFLISRPRHQKQIYLVGFIVYMIENDEVAEKVCTDGGIFQLQPSQLLKYFNSLSKEQKNIYNWLRNDTFSDLSKSLIEDLDYRLVNKFGGKEKNFYQCIKSQGEGLNIKIAKFLDPEANTINQGIKTLTSKPNGLKKIKEVAFLMTHLNKFMGGDLEALVSAKTISGYMKSLDKDSKSVFNFVFNIGLALILQNKFE